MGRGGSERVPGSEGDDWLQGFLPLQRSFILFSRSQELLGKNRALVVKGLGRK